MYTLSRNKYPVAPGKVDATAAETPNSIFEAIKNPEKHF